MSTLEVICTFVLGTIYGGFILPLFEKVVTKWAKQFEKKELG